jgi:hypothetical protein
VIAHADRAGVEWVPADALFDQPLSRPGVQQTGRA